LTLGRKTEMMLSSNKEGTEIGGEVVTAGVVQTDDIDEYMTSTGSTFQGTYFDGGSPFVYPQLDLSEKEAAAFLHGARLIVAGIRDAESGTEEEEWLKDAFDRAGIEGGSK
jgi:hypothetical protein